jgi:amino acid transporter
MTRTDTPHEKIDAHKMPTTHSTALRVGSIGVFAMMFFVFSTQAPLTGLGGATALAVGLGNGAGAPGAYLVVGLVIALFAVGFVALSRHVTTQGGFYSYVSVALGRRLGASAAWLAVLTYVSIQASMYGLYGVSVSALLSPLGINLPWWVYVAITLAFVHFMGTRSIELGAKILTVLVGLEVALLTVFAVKVLIEGGGPEGLNAAASFAPSAVLAGTPGVAIVFAIASMYGFESTAIYAGEAKDPKKTVARATYLSVATIAVFFAFVAWMIVSFYGPSDAANAALSAINGGDTTAFVFNAMATELGAWAGLAAQILLITSLLASLMALHNSVNRYFHSMALHGSLPITLGRTNRHLAPSRAAVVQTILTLALIAPFAILGLNPAVTLFAWGGGVSVAALMAVYILTSISVVVYFTRHRVGVGPWQSVIAPVVSGLFLIALLVLIVVNFNQLVGGDALLAWLLLALIPATFVAAYGYEWYLIARNRSAGELDGLTERRTR